MKKRLLAAIMAMILAFTLAPTMSAAEEESADWEINNA